MKDRISWLIVYISMLLMAGGSIWISNENSKENGRKFCDIITTVNGAYKTGPEPTTDLGRKLKADYAALESRLDC